MLLLLPIPTAPLPALRRYCAAATPSLPLWVPQDAVVHSRVSQGDLGQDQGTGLSVCCDDQSGHCISLIFF